MRSAGKGKKPFPSEKPYIMSRRGIFVILIAVHVAALVKGIAWLRFQNTVFPFASNALMMALATVFELWLAIYCTTMAGRKPADFCISAFVAVMIWYKIGLHLTNPGGYSCGCMGILTVLLHLEASREEGLSYAVLVLLALCTMPGLIQYILSRTRFPARRTILFLWVCISTGNLSGQGIQLRGQYQYDGYNPKTGEPYADQKGVYDFFVAIAPPAWKICVTNTGASKVWSELVYDGTNLITLNPYGPPFFAETKTQEGTAFATVSRSPYYLSAVSDWAHIFVPWLTFGLNPADVQTNKAGLSEIPLPWQTVRVKPRAFGWNWRIVPLDGGRFLASAKVIRDLRLDVNRHEDLLRSNMDYPEDITERNRDLEQIAYRSSLPDGFIGAEYECDEQIQTNGFIIPVKSHWVSFMYLYPKFPDAKATLTVTSVQDGDPALATLSSPPTASVIHDYRYKRMSRSRIYKYAEYQLSAGEPWKGASDPDLLEKVEIYMKHGPKFQYNDYGSGQIISWVLAALLLGVPVILMINHKKHKMKESL